MKKYFLGIIAIIMAITFSAFTVEKNKASTGTQENFTYNDYPDDTWINDPTHYTLFTGTLDCNGSAHRCAVSANDDGTGHPVLSGAVIFTKD